MSTKIVISVDGTTNSGSTTIAYLINHILDLHGIKSDVTDRDGAVLTCCELPVRLNAIRNKELSVSIEIEPLCDRDRV